MEGETELLMEGNEMTGLAQIEERHQRLGKKTCALFTVIGQYDTKPVVNSYLNDFVSPKTRKCIE